jgi:Mn-containing catalase
VFRHISGLQFESKPGRPQAPGRCRLGARPNPLLYATYDGAMGEPGGPAMGTESGLTGKIKDVLS